jgi:hypothetical protein
MPRDILRALFAARYGMKKWILAAAALCLLTALPSCGPEASDTTGSEYELALNFAAGPSNPDNPIYAAWIESPDGDFVRYLYVCERLDYLALTGTSDYTNIKDRKTCPYWRTSLYETPREAGIDVVSGPTIEAGKAAFGEFTKKISLPALSPSTFTVYFEIDHSFDVNDWWTDQPALLYAADVDLSKGPAAKSFPLTVRGWSRNAPGGGGSNDNRADSDFPNATEIGELVSEMRYITNHADVQGALFGSAYGPGSAEDATNMVGSLTLKATRK